MHIAGKRQRLPISAADVSAMTKPTTFERPLTAALIHRPTGE